MERELKVCIAGCGSIGRVHAEGYAELGRKMKIIFRSSKEERAREFADRYGGEWCTDYAKALEEVDIVDICTTPDLHMSMACDAFAAGKHVLVEKPMARNLREVNRILACAEKAGTKLMLCENLAFHPHILGIDRALAQGEIGKPFLLEIGYLDFWSALKREDSWFAQYKKVGGGILTENGSHYLYLIRKWCRDLESVFARMSHATFNRRGEDTAVVVANDRSGFTATLHISWGAPGGGGIPRIAVYGTEGMLLSTDNGLFLDAGNDRNKSKRRKLCDGSFMSLWWEAVKTGVRVFVECVDKDTEPPVTGKMGRDIQELIEAAARSAQEGIVVRIFN